MKSTNRLTPYADCVPEEEERTKPGPDNRGTVFVIEPDGAFRADASEFLRLADYRAVCFPKLRSIAAALGRQQPDLIVIADALPDGSGLSFVRDFRSSSSVPIIMISARGSESDRVTALELGVDDYLTKPVSLKELVLRVDGLLRRRSAGMPAGPVLWRCGQHSLKLSLPTHKLHVDGEAVRLTAAEWRLLTFLVGEEGAVVSRGKIMDHCFQYSAEVYDRIVDTHVKNLRAKLMDPAWIETVKGFGYRFAGLASTSASAPP